MLKFILLYCFLALSLNSFSQIRTGLLIGGGIGFEQGISVDKNNTEFLNGTLFSDTYSYNALLGYRFRFENRTHNNLFFDVDPVLKLQTFLSSDFVPGDGNIYTSVTKESHFVNFSFAVSSSVNYSIIKGLYAGFGIEPTWNIVTDAKPFDIPIFGRVGYNVNNKIDFAITYKQGFTNVINDNRYSKGNVSDLNLSIFIPFTLK